MVELIQYAKLKGATDAAIIPAKEILVEDHLAEFCKPPGCANYGQGMSCPPQVSGPSGFRKLLAQFEFALVFKIETFSDQILSPEGIDIFRLLHEIASGLQQQATLMGFSNAKGFAGGSCKNIFCLDQEACNVIVHGGPCRHPLKAMPSMSGFGINVSKLMAAAGWEMKKELLKNDPLNKTPLSVSGLVLIC